VTLKQMHRPFLEASVVGINGSVSSFVDESAEVGFDITGVKVEDLRTTPTTLVVFSNAVFIKSPRSTFSPRSTLLSRKR